MREYSVVPEFSYYRTFPFAVIGYQLLSFGFVLLGYYVIAISYIAAAILQFVAVYFLCLLLCNKNFQLHITSTNVTVWDIFHRARQYTTGQIRWKIKRIPWYNTYFVALYSTGRMPIAILKPHWKNVSKILKFPHHGPLTAVERKYIKFLKSVGLMY